MNYAEIKENDITNGEDICVSLWVSGCNFHCAGCHNQALWDFNYGKEFSYETMKEILGALEKNGIKRNFSILGGEPLCPENRNSILDILRIVRNYAPDIKIFLWTGYTIEELIEEKSQSIKEILSLIDILIDDRYKEDKRDISLKWRGSSNQKIYNLGNNRKI